MDFRILLVCLVVTLYRVQCQECKVVSICNYEDEISNSARNLNTGNTGRRRKKGNRSFSRKIAAFQQEIRNLMTDLNHSVSLLESKLNTAIGRIDDLTSPGFCSQSDIVGSQVNAADEKNYNLSRPVNCSQSDEDGPQFLSSGESVYCHQHWRVIQRRFNGQVIFHNKTWNEYQNGFGDLSTEFWIGLDKIHRLTGNGGCRLRVELGAFDGSEAYAEYRQFSIGCVTDLFRLHISGYNGTAGDAMMSAGIIDNTNMAFTTVDRDNDKWRGENCATYHGGGSGGWWFNSKCGYAKLNGRWAENLPDPRRSFIWYTWHYEWITLKSSMMMVRCD